MLIDRDNTVDVDEPPDAQLHMLPYAGWSHFAQFTIAVVNKDPKKSKYSGVWLESFIHLGFWYDSLQIAEPANSGNCLLHWLYQRSFCWSTYGITCDKWLTWWSVPNQIYLHSCQSAYRMCASFTPQPCIIYKVL